MDIKIEDGTGKGHKSKVSSDKRLLVDSLSRPQSINAALKGEAFNLNTGAINITDDTESGLYYLSYTGEGNLIITELLCIIGSSTGGSGIGEIKIYKNPTEGTLISGASDIPIIENRDFGSSNILDVNAYKGSSGSTISGNVFADTSRSSFPVNISFDASVIVLRKGTSLAVSYNPPSGNTSQSIKIATTCFTEEI